MLTLILGSDWKQNRHEILNMLSNDVQQKKSRTILMVPELVSHQMERELAAAAGDTASRFAEVLTFTRLSKRVSEELSVHNPECMDNGGRIVAMAAAVRQLHSKLKAYAAVETKPEFLLNMLDAVDEFKRCCISSADLIYAAKQTEGSLSQRLEELALIYEAYNAVCLQGKRDPRDQMTWLLEQLEDSDYAAKHQFYFDAFPDFSRQHMDILCHLLCNSPRVVISLNCDMPGSKTLAYEKAGETAKEILSFVRDNHIEYTVQTLPGTHDILSDVISTSMQGPISPVKDAPIRLFKANSAYEECAAVSDRIIRMIHDGCRYRDISIVCTDMHKYNGPIKTVLQRANIPVYISGTESMIDKPVINSVLSALEAALGGFSQSDVLRYLKSLLSPVDMDLADRMENYAIVWSVDGKRWLSTWEENPYGLGKEWTDSAQTLLQRLNDGRQKAIAPLSQLRDDFQCAISVCDQVNAVYRFLKDTKLEHRLRNLANKMEQEGKYADAQVMNQLWEILVGALEQVYDVLAETVWDSDTFSRLLKLLLSQYDVGTIPSVLDAVTVGSVSAMRCHKTKHLFLIGASEGSLPNYASASGILNDQERSMLIKMGLSINPGTIDGLQTQFSEIHEVLSSAEKSISLSYSAGQPSYIYDRIQTMSAAEETICNPLGAAATDPFEAASYLICREAHKSASILQIQEEIDTILSKKRYQLGDVDETNVRALYGQTMKLSATQIDKMANCRMSYYLKYGLGAKERIPARVDPAEFGTYVHEVLEKTGKAIISEGGFRSVSLDRALEIASEYSSEYFVDRFSKINSDRMSFHFHKNTKELLLIVRELWQELQQSDFQPVDFELYFGDDGKMPSIPINGKKLKAQLSGYVDRVDIWETDGKLYLRVVDYKTGVKDFDYCDIINGYGLQMLLYLYALEDGGEDVYGMPPQVAGVQYFPARIPYVKAEGSLTEEEAATKRATELKRKGLVLNDDSVLYAMENSENPFRLSISKKADGTVSGDLASAAQFQKLKTYIMRFLQNMVDEIADGKIDPNPYTRGDKHNACKYCPYDSICLSFQVEGRRNYKAISADRFWAEIEEEV